MPSRPPDPQRIQGVKQHPRRCTDAQMHRPSLTTWLTTCKGKEAARAIERAGDHPDDRQHHQGDKPHQGETTAPRIQSERAGAIMPRSGSDTPQGITRPSGAAWLTTCKGMKQHSPQDPEREGGGDHAPIWKRHTPEDHRPVWCYLVTTW